MKSAIFAIAIASVVPAYAALPPFADSAEQMKTVLDSEAVAGAVDWSFARGLEHVGQNAAGNIEWRILTPDCTVLVEIRALALPVQNGVPMVGAVHYEVVAVAPCRAPAATE